MGSSDPPRFQCADWSEIDRRRRLVTPERVTLVMGLVVYLAVLLYDTYATHVYIAGAVVMRPVDWAVLLGLVVLFAYGVVPAVVTPT